MLDLGFLFQLLMWLFLLPPPFPNGDVAEVRGESQAWRSLCEYQACDSILLLILFLNHGFHESVLGTDLSP